MLLHTDLKYDARAVGQVDPERVGSRRRQVAGRHVKDPLTIAKAESRRRETQRAA